MLTLSLGTVRAPGTSLPTQTSPGQYATPGIRYDQGAMYPSGGGGTPTTVMTPWQGGYVQAPVGPAPMPPRTDIPWMPTNTTPPPPQVNQPVVIPTLPGVEPTVPFPSGSPTGVGPTISTTPATPSNGFLSWGQFAWWKPVAIAGGIAIVGAIIVSILKSRRT